MEQTGKPNRFSVRGFISTRKMFATLLFSRKFSDSVFGRYWTEVRTTDRIGFVGGKRDGRDVAEHESTVVVSIQYNTRVCTSGLGGAHSAIDVLRGAVNIN